MRFTDIFSDKAALYAMARPRYPVELFACISEMAANRTCAWDCGTGNGQAAISLAEYFETVLATDPSTEQIANAIPAGNVRYSVQTAETTTFPSQTFDAVCVAQALHWFKFDTFFCEVRRVAKPGAIFCAWGYDWFRIEQNFDRVFQETILDIVAPFWAPENRTLWNAYSEVPFPFDRMTLPPLQIVSHWNLYQLMAYVRTWSAVRRCQAECGRDFLVVAEQRLAPLWGRVPESERTITMRLHTLAGRVV